MVATALKPARAAVEAPPCTARTPRCPRTYKGIRACCRAHQVRMVKAVAPILTAAGIRWWADYGTLLGSLQNPLHGRKPGIMPHDKDSDFGFLAVDKQRFVDVLPEIRELGFVTVVKPPNGRLYGRGDYIAVLLSAENNSNIDFFPWYSRADGLLERREYMKLDQYKGREFPRGKLLPLGRVEWEGMMLPAPRDPEWFVHHRYGNQWREPIAANHRGELHA